MLQSVDPPSWPRGFIFWYKLLVSTQLRLMSHVSCIQSVYIEEAISSTEWWCSRRPDVFFISYPRRIRRERLRLRCCNYQMFAGQSRLLSLIKGVDFFNGQPGGGVRYQKSEKNIASPQNSPQKVQLPSWSGYSNFTSPHNFGKDFRLPSEKKSPIISINWA